MGRASFISLAQPASDKALENRPKAPVLDLLHELCQLLNAARLYVLHPVAPRKVGPRLPQGREDIGNLRHNGLGAPPSLVLLEEGPDTPEAAGLGELPHYLSLRLALRFLSQPLGQGPGYIPGHRLPPVVQDAHEQQLLCVEPSLSLHGHHGEYGSYLKGVFRYRLSHGGRYPPLEPTGPRYVLQDPYVVGEYPRIHPTPPPASPSPRGFPAP